MVGKKLFTISALLTLLSYTCFAADINDYQIKVIDRYVAIDNVCAWPNLTLLNDGTILAMVFSEPNHGRIDGDVQCFASTDNGKTFRYRSTPAKHTPGSNRMNFAAGLANNGDVLVLSSGWINKPSRNFSLLPVIVCRSSDKGHCWNVTENALKLTEGRAKFVPYGNIITIPPDKLAVAMHWPWVDPNADPDQNLPLRDLHVLENDYVNIVFSSDDGKTWGPENYLISKNSNETTILRLNDNNFLAAARTSEIRIASLKLFTSKDKGQTWQFTQSVSDKAQHPGNLLKLADGSILLTYGNRNSPRSIKIRISNDNGKTWSVPHELVTLYAGDCGYPSTVQLKDSTLVTAYYAEHTPWHTRYHMGIIRWKVLTMQ